MKSLLIVMGLAGCVAAYGQGTRLALGEPDKGCWCPWSQLAHGWDSLLASTSVSSFTGTVKLKKTIAPSRTAVVNYLQPALADLLSHTTAPTADYLILTSAYQYGKIDYFWSAEGTWTDGKSKYDHRAVELTQSYLWDDSIPFRQNWNDTIVAEHRTPKTYCRKVSESRLEAWVPQLLHIPNYSWQRSPAMLPPYSAEPTFADYDRFTALLQKNSRGYNGGKDLYWVDVLYAPLDGWLNPPTSSKPVTRRIYFWLAEGDSTLSSLNSENLATTTSMNMKCYDFAAFNSTLNYSVWVDRLLKL